MLLFRHDYLRKVDNFNPNWLKDYKTTIEITASIMYEKYQPSMYKVGLDIDDAVLLSQLFAVYYMSLYSIHKDEETYKVFQQKFFDRHGKAPDKSDQKRVNKNQLINFIRQRFKHVNTMCSRKAKNIICGHDIKLAFARTDKSTPAADEEILLDHKKHGYRKITKNELKTAQKEARAAGTRLLFDQFGFPILEIEKLSTPIDRNEYDTIIESNRNEYNSSPESFFENKKEDAELMAHKGEFTKMATEEKIKVLKRFVNENKGSTILRKELRTARKMIKEMKNVV